MTTMRKGFFMLPGLMVCLVGCRPETVRDEREHLGRRFKRVGDARDLVQQGRGRRRVGEVAHDVIRDLVEVGLRAFGYLNAH